MSEQVGRKRSNSVVSANGNNKNKAIVSEEIEEENNSETISSESEELYESDKEEGLK